MENMSLEEWISSIGGISEAGMSKLEKATIISVQAVKAISEEDINEVKLGVGDRALFKAGWRKLTGISDKIVEPPKVEPPKVEGPPIPPRSPSIVTAEAASYSLADFAELLKVLPAASLAASVQPLQQPVVPAVPVRRFGVAPEEVTPQTLSKNQALRDLASSLGHNIVKDSLDLDYYAEKGCKGEKCLLPVNFATVLGGNFGEDEEVISTGEYGGRMVWQTGKANARKPTPDRLNYGQFYEATARILRVIQLTPEAEIEYLDYLRQLGVLSQTFSCASVFTLDHLHRLSVFRNGGRWNVIENSLENATLKKKDDANRSQSHGTGGKGARQKDYKASTPKVIGPDTVCWKYNLHNGCTYGDTCYYPHVCSVDGCRGKHPAYKHVFGSSKQSS
jgi:hypothetical protein